MNAYGTEVADYLKQYKHRVVINYLTVVDGLIILGTGGAIGYEVAKTGTLTLTVKGATVIPAIGYTAATWEVAVENAMNNIDTNKTRYHIMLVKHNWDVFVSNPVWTDISMYVQKTMLYGSSFVNQETNMPGKRLVIGGHTVEVMYIIIEGVLKITNAWVAK